jgi:ferredoxin
MKEKLEVYPGARQDMARLAKWLGRKIRERLQGREYVMNREDFRDLARGIRLSNWLMPLLAEKKWYQRYLEAVFGPLERPKIQSRVIPLNAPVKKSKNAVIPYQLIDDFLDQTGFKMILDECLCRRGMECRDYPIDFGCIMLGEGARTMLENGHGREVTAAEAKAHVRKAQEHGLVVFAAHAKGEEQMMGIPKALHGNFIELCFCCPCCCVAMKNLKYYTADIHQHNFINVGFVAKALPDCKGCNTCVNRCAAGAIQVNGNKVWVKEDICIGCGVCQNVCRHDAIRLVQIGRPKGALLDYFDGQLQLDLS